MQAIIPSKLKILNDSVPEDEAPLWDAAPEYLPADRVIHDHYVYECVAANVNVPPATGCDYDGAPWRTLGVTNKYACIDIYRSTQTIAPEGETTLTIRVPFARPSSGFGLLNMSATSVKATVLDPLGENVIWGGDARMLTRDTTSLHGFFFDPLLYDEDWTATNIPPISGMLEVELYGGRPAIGSIIVGEHVRFGSTAFGPSFGFRDYSVNTADDFGNPVWVKRRNARIGSFTVFIRPRQLDYVQQKLADMAGNPALWIGDNGAGFQSMVIFGFLKKYDPTLRGPQQGEATFDIEGIV